MKNLYWKRIYMKMNDGQDAETDITVDNTNPPACGQGVIYIKE